MLGSEVLEVGIGLVLLFLFVSLICTAVQEGIEALFKMRAKDLERGIGGMLSDKDGTSLEAFYNHPLIFSLFGGDYKKAGHNLPSYIPATSRTPSSTYWRTERITRAAPPQPSLLLRTAPPQPSLLLRTAPPQPSLPVNLRSIAFAAPSRTSAIRNCNAR